MNKWETRPGGTDGVIGAADRDFAQPPLGRRRQPGDIGERVPTSSGLELGRLVGGESRNRLYGATKVGDVGGASNFGQIGKLPQGSGQR